MNSNVTSGHSSTVMEQSVRLDSIEAESAVAPYDEFLLEKARTQWQFGDWQSLSRIEMDSLKHHPDRDKLALLAAAGHLQAGNPSQARSFIRFALEWGCSKKLVTRILAAGVHNSLGRASAVIGQRPRALKHFEGAILVGTPGSDARLIADARVDHQYKLLGLTETNPVESAAPGEQIVSSVTESDDSYLFHVPLRINNTSTISLGLNTWQADWISVENDTVVYTTEKGAPLYCVSNETGNFEKAPQKVQLAVQPDTAYLLTGVIGYTGETPPVVWIFQYANGKKIDAHSATTQGGRFRLGFRTQNAVDKVAIGLRLGGTGSLQLRDTGLRLQEQTHEEITLYFDEQLQKIKQAQKQDVENSMKQIEACIRLQHYLGPETLLPDVHNWPISPDFGVLLINLVEQNEYDAVIEFGSGTSTLILAKALDRVARREGRDPSPLLSFDHLQEYAEKTKKILRQAGLVNHVDVVTAPLSPWKDENSEQYSYYACDEALQALKGTLPETEAKILVLVDGPPAATGKHARYPALPKVLGVFSGNYTIHFLLDDYLRAEEREIAARWLGKLKEQKLAHTQTEINNLEKKACLIEVLPVQQGDPQ